MFVADSSHGENIESEDELRSHLKQRAHGVGNQFWLSSEPEGFPALVLVVNGTKATVSFVNVDGVMDGIALAGGPIAETNEMVRFDLPPGVEPVDFCADTVLAWDRAVDCAVEFLKRRTRPTSVVWREL